MDPTATGGLGYCACQEYIALVVVPPSALQHLVQTLSLPKLQVHLRRCDPTPCDQCCGERVLLCPLCCSRPRKITTAETQSHPRGANAKIVQTWRLDIRNSVVKTSTQIRRCLVAVPMAHGTRGVECLSKNGCLFRAAEMAPKVKAHPLSACHLVYRSCPGSWLSFVYPTGKCREVCWPSVAVKSPATASSESHCELDSRFPRVKARSRARGIRQSVGRHFLSDCQKGNLISDRVSNSSCSERRQTPSVWGKFQKPSNGCQARCGVSIPRTTVTQFFEKGSDGAPER